MRSVHVDFYKKNRWLGPWLILALLAIPSGLFTYWRFHDSATLSRLTQQQISDVNAKIRAEGQEELKRANVDGGAARKADNLFATTIISAEWNTFFTPIENIKLPGARVVTAHADMSTNSVRLEYELQSIEQASELTDLLNSGYDAKPWKLESVSATGGTGGGPPPVLAGRTAMRSIWSAKVSELK